MNKRIKKIAYITGTRADFGLMTPILKAIDNSGKLDLHIYATGVHLMPEFGNTIKQVKDEFNKVVKINVVFKKDNRAAMANFTGEFMVKLNKALIKDRPDFILTLGDRPEMLVAAISALYLGIPTGHVHGGEKTYTVDELARHAITKLSHLHFPATKESAVRIERMGEERERIHTVGAPALDAILGDDLPDRNKLFDFLGIDPKQKIILVTQHPVSEEAKDAGRQIEITLAAVKTFKLPTVVIYPHADAGGRKIIFVINREKKSEFFYIFPNLPYKYFLALEREAAVWVGNSSAAMIESSSFKVPVVNIGTRQTGRQRGDNVIDTGYSAKEIKEAISKSLFDKKYLLKLSKIISPWGDGKTGPRVAKILEELKIDSKLLNKQITY